MPWCNKLSLNLIPYGHQGVPAVPFLTQRPANAPGKVQEESPGDWISPMWETWENWLAPGFKPAQLLTLRPCRERTRWKLLSLSLLSRALSLCLSFSHSAFQIKNKQFFLNEEGQEKAYHLEKSKTQNLKWKKDNLFDNVYQM